MAYQILARKWRPQDFTSLIGQDHIVTALRNALTEDRVAQAYIFSGIRGVGKTTAARVLSKALNCDRKVGSEERPSVDPCNSCSSCKEITEGSDVINVREIDAATFSKVDQIRELTESLRLGSTSSEHHKVVIIDEVHRLSRQAFDALLKIVEEPPPRLVFIFATTELESVPATILSRCHEFQFRRVPSPLLAVHLRRISNAEDIVVSDTALRMIARAGEGSVRDSVALLDQLTTFGGGQIRDQDANHLLGGLDAEVFGKLLAGILAGEQTVITNVVHEIETFGWDPSHVYSQFLSYTRDALHLILSGRTDAVDDIAVEEATDLHKLIKHSSYENLISLVHLLLQGEFAVRRSGFGILALEIMWRRAAELPKITRLEDLFSGRRDFSMPPQAQGSTQDVPTRLRAIETDDRNKCSSIESGRQQQRSKIALAEPFNTPQNKKTNPDNFKKFKSALSRRPSLAARFSSKTELSLDSMVLTIKTNDSTLGRALERKPNKDFLDQILTEIWGKGISYMVRFEDIPESGHFCSSPSSSKQVEDAILAPSKSQEILSPLFERAKMDTRVQTVLRHFPGPIKSVRLKATGDQT